MKQIIFFIVLVFNSFLNYAQSQQWTSTLYSGRMFTGMFTGLEFAKKSKNHEWYIGIGMHNNSVIDDKDGMKYTFLNKAETTSYLNSFGPKGGWRRLFIINSSMGQLVFYPFIENHWLYAGIKNEKVLDQNSRPQLADVQEERFLTTSINFGLGARVYVNDNISFSINGGWTVGAIFPVSIDMNYYNNKWQPIFERSGTNIYNWQVGINYTFK